MSAWPFVIAAYAITILGTLGITWWAFATMRRAEADADRLRRDN